MDDGAQKRIDRELWGWALMFGLSPLALGLPIMVLSWIENTFG